ncbi:SDR family oxidoreductase [Massilia yuzhufengensis]|uniref:3-oxoacyl-[acyl-carrier protein] reductase n=1 Tax=Massilia yuzhufengensis TaxID=1164594 RepID=A0A1I1LHJ0_9BURK|nr:SDR family oxidoreductase [Massilia yuzhufengensis]SFC72584.1 3-oxoacyl-[acyl-carrier protein] reductase [Massilia yuzhufengensis]
MNQDTRPVAIVTGASRGIGAAIAQRLAEDGYRLVVNYASNEAEAHRVIATLRATGHTAIAVKADVSKADEVRAMFDAAERELGKVDVLVNNAGVLKTMPLAETSDELFAQTLGVNVQGTFNTLREAATRLNDGGRIVNFSITVLAMKLPGYAVYSASKAAVEAMSGVFAKELRGRRIRVNTVAPGPVATELFFSGKTKEQIDGFAKMPPIERLGEPGDIARIVSFLVSEESGWINGQVLRANGGTI